MKKNISKILIATLALSSMFSFSAIAQEVAVQPTNPVVDENTPQIQKGYTTETGTVTSVVIETDGQEEYARIEVANDDIGVIFTTKTTTPVYDAKDGSLKTVKDITEGMTITGVLPELSIMTMSIPPITPSAVAFVIGAEGSNVMVSKFNDDLLSADNSLKLNIGENTSIVSFNGTKEMLNADSIKNNEAIVIYGPTTRSIPAQTTPTKVVILPSEETATTPETPAPQPRVEEETITLNTLMPVRQLADEKGFNIVWTSNEAPVILEKGETKIEIQLNSTEFKVNGEAKSFTTPVIIENGTMSVSAEIVQYLQ